MKLELIMDKNTAKVASHLIDSAGNRGACMEFTIEFAAQMQGRLDNSVEATAIPQTMKIKIT